MIVLCVLTDEMPFEPRDVVVCRERNFADFYSVGEQIGRSVGHCQTVAASDISAALLLLSAKVLSTCLSVCLCPGLLLK